LQLVSSFEEMERAFISGSKEMMVGCNTRFTNEQATAPDKFIVAIYPNIKVLLGFIARKRNVHTFYDPPSLGR